MAFLSYQRQSTNVLAYGINVTVLITPAISLSFSTLTFLVLFPNCNLACYYLGIRVLGISIPPGQKLS